MEQKLRTQNDVASAGLLAGTRILLLEDEFAVSSLLISAIESAGGTVLALTQDIDDALQVIRTADLSAAIITMIADGIYTDIVAQELTTRRVPFAVTTGIGTDDRHPALHAARTITKPFQAAHIRKVLADLVGRDEALAPLT